MKDYKSSIIALNLKNFHLWLKKVREVAKKSKIMKYIDSDDELKELVDSIFSRFSDYLMNENSQSAKKGVPIAPFKKRSANKYIELFDEQRKTYKVKMSTFQIIEKMNDRINQEIRVIDAAIKASARIYILSNGMKSPVREILQMLQQRYERLKNEIIEQVFEQLEQLKIPSTKEKIETGIAEGKNVRNFIINKSMKEIFESKTIFVKEFLKVGRAGTPNFCHNGMQQKRTTEKSIEFFAIIRQYRLAVEENMKTTMIKGQANMITLQGIFQESKISKNQPNQQKKKGRYSNNSNISDSKNEKKQCLCEKIHLYKNCLYIKTLTRQSGWKENKQLKKIIKQKIRTYAGYYISIKNIIDTDLLNEISESSPNRTRRNFGNSKNDENDESFKIFDEKHTSYSFANAAYAADRYEFINSLDKSVVYDSDAAEHLTYEKSRFVGEITSITYDHWIDTPNELMKIEDYEIMLIKGSLHDKSRDLLFENTAFVPESDVTLINSNALQDKSIGGNMKDNILYNSKNDEKICLLIRKFDLSTLKYNSMTMTSEILVNTIKPYHLERAISGVWHLRLSHCRPEVIDQIRKIKGVKVTADEIPKTVKCITCAVSKMKKIINRGSTERAIKLFQILHFDLIINNMSFDESRCIIHFTDEFTFYCGVFFFSNHKKATLLSVFKSLINRCDRTRLAIGAVVSMIRTDQKTSIENILQNGINQQEIQGNGSTKNTFSQNEISKRYEALLIEKSKCMLVHAKLSEDLYSETYLATTHIMNRASIKSLNGESPLIAIERITNQTVKGEIFHFKMFGCKAYSLLKNADKSAKNEKMKPRAFIDYLIDYNSINIFRIWDLDKKTISEYRDVIFNEKEYYDTYNKSDLLKKAEKASFVEFRILKSRSSFDSLNVEDEDWLDTSIRNRSVLEILFSSSEGVVENDEKNETVSDDAQSSTSRNSSISKQLDTSDDTPFMTLDFMTPDTSKQGTKYERISRFFTSTSGDDDLVNEFQSISSQNVTQKRKEKTKISYEQLLMISQILLDIIEIRSRRVEFSADIEEFNIIERKRTRRPNMRYANAAGSKLTDQKKSKLSISHAAFHLAFMTEINKIASNEKIKRIHLNDLPDPPSNGRVMKRHPHVKSFMKATNQKYSFLMTRGTGKVIDKNASEVVNPVFLKGIFIYKFDENGYFSKYKARLMVKGDLQEYDTQDVYAATLAFKVFRSLMTLMAAFGLKTHQLDAINVFFNAKNDESIYCYLSDGFRKLDKMMKIIRALYDQKKSSLLGFRTLSFKCRDLSLHQISNESCLFINDDGVFLFFYVDDIIIAYRSDKFDQAHDYIRRIEISFEVRNMNQMKFFLKVRIIRNIRQSTLTLMQDTYMNKIVKNYDIDITKKASASFLPDTLEKYDGKVNKTRMHEYRKKVKSMCYSIVITRLDIAKIAFKLSKFLINSGSEHLVAIDNCIKYMYATKHLEIQYSASINKKDMIVQVFEIMTDAFYANYSDRKSDEKYIFRLFDDLIDGVVRKQITVIISIIEAELLSLLHAGKELMWGKNLFSKLRFNIRHNLIIYNDNRQTIRFMTSEISRVETKLKHIDVAQCGLRQEVQNGHLNVDYILTDDMMTDNLIKLFSSLKHKAFVQQLGLVNLEKIILKLSSEEEGK